jgi:hypothetical protein
MTALQSIEECQVNPDLTMVTVVVPCNVCGNPVRGERFAFAKDEDLIGNLVHFDCAAISINQ